MRFTIRKGMIIVALAAILCSVIVTLWTAELPLMLPLYLCAAAVLLGPWLLVAIGLWLFPIVPNATWKGTGKSEPEHHNV